MFVGIDIGGTKTEGVVLDGDAQVLASSRIPTERGPRGVVEGVHTLVRSLLAVAGGTPHDIRGLGIGVPGVVDEAGVTRNAVNLAVAELDLPNELAADYPFPVAVDNDVRAAALGAHLLDGAGTASLAYLNLGTGVAAGVVHRGALLRGATGVAGEIGHFPLDPAGPCCGCGQRGCIEAYAGGAAIARRHPAPAAAPRGVPAVAALFDAADAGAADAVTIRAEMIDAVYRAVLLLALTADADTVVLGGGTTRLGRRLMEPLLERAAADGEDSPFVAGLRLRERVRFAPEHVPVTAVGAAGLVRPPR